MLKQQRHLRQKFLLEFIQRWSARSASYPAQRHRAVPALAFTSVSSKEGMRGWKFSSWGPRGQLWAGPGPPTAGPACEGLRLCSRWEGLQGHLWLLRGRGSEARGTIWTALCFSGRTTSLAVTVRSDREGIPKPTQGSSEARGAEVELHQLARECVIRQ